MNRNGDTSRTDYLSDHPTLRTEPEADRLLTAQEVANRWQVKPAHVYALARDERLPRGAVIDLGRYRRFSLAGIKEFESNGGTAA